MFSNIGMRCRNYLKTAALFSVIWLVLALIWAACGLRLPMLIWFVVLGIILSVCAYWLSDKLAIRMVNAIEVSEDEEPILYGIVREISARIERPMPHLYVAPMDSPNVFAIGRSERHSVICCTRGLLNILNERELRGVVSHELIHIYNHDILNSTIASAIATIMTYVGYVLTYSKKKHTADSEFAVRSESSKSRCPVLKIVGQVLNVIFVPVGALMIKLVVSRSREFDADKSAGMLTGDPAALASALNKISYGAKIHEMSRAAGLQAMSSLMIVNPFEDDKSKLLKMFSNQSAVKERVNFLRLMAKSQEDNAEYSGYAEMSYENEAAARPDEFDKSESVFNIRYGRRFPSGVVAVSGA